MWGNITFHPRVFSEIDAIMKYYEDVADTQLADEFYLELRSAVGRAAQNPEYFHQRVGGFKRVNLQRFPYHFLFREVGDGIRILVVRHHARSPGYGTGRK